MTVQIRILLYSIALGLGSMAFAADGESKSPIDKQANPQIQPEIASPQLASPVVDTGVRLSPEQQKKLEERRDERRKQRQAMIEKLKNASPEERTRIREEIRRNQEKRNQEFQSEPRISDPEHLRQIHRAEKIQERQQLRLERKEERNGPLRENSSVDN